MREFLSWNKWLFLRESNARKRAVIASTKKLAPSMPGSTAACPNTNPVAMNQADKKGVVGFKENLHLETDKSPNYSFDQWLKKAQKLGDDVKDLVDKGKSEVEDIEKKKKESEKEAEKKKKSSKSEKRESPERSEKEAESKDDKKSDNKRHEDLWNKLNQKLIDIKSKKPSTTKSTKPTKNSGEH